MAETPKTGPTPPLTPQDEARKLAQLFDAAYHYNPHSKALEPKDKRGAAVGALQAELDRLDQSTFLSAAKGKDSEAAKAALAQWDLPSITRYWYLTDPRLTPADRGLLWRLGLDSNDKNHASPMEAANYMAKVEIDEVDRYDGKGIPFFFQPRADGLLYGVQYFIGEERTAFAARENALQVAMPTYHKFPDLSEEDRRNLYFQPTPRLTQTLGELRKRILVSQDPSEKKKAAQKYDYLSFLIASRDEPLTTTERLKTGCHASTKEASDETCVLQAAEEEAAKTVSPWDNYRLQLGFKERLGRLAKRAARLIGKPGFVGTDLLMQDGLLTRVRAGDFGEPITGNWVDKTSGEPIPRNWVNEMMQPLAQVSGQALDALLAGLGGSPLFHGLLDLDDGTGATLRWFLDRGRGNIQGMLVVDKLGGMEGVGEPAGTALRTARIAVINAGPLKQLVKDEATAAAMMENPSFQYAMAIYHLALLVHETSHLQFPREEVLKNPALAQAHLLDERNGYLRESQILRWGLEHLPPGAPETQAPFKKFLFAAYAESRLTALSANIGLGYPTNDDAIRTDLAAPAWDPRLELYPTDFKDSWLASTYPSVAKPDERRKQFEADLKDQLGLADVN